VKSLLDQFANFQWMNTDSQSRSLTAVRDLNFISLFPFSTAPGVESTWSLYLFCRAAAN